MWVVLEEFEQRDVEHVGVQKVIQYRNSILPLIWVSEALEERRQKPQERRNILISKIRDSLLQVVVVHKRNRNIGLVVDRIIDIVEEVLEEKQEATRNGVLGSAVIQERVTEILDVLETFTKV